MSKIDEKYQELVRKVYHTGFGYEDPNRKGVIRKQIPYYTLEHSFEDGFPIIGLKQTYPKMAFNEVKAFMMGKTNLRDLEEFGVTFWREDCYNYYLKNKAKNENPYEYDSWLKEVLNNGSDNDGKITGDLGKIYSHQIRNWNDNIDQLNEVLERLKKNPMSTKNIVTMWNPSDLDECALSPCHRDFELIIEPLNWKQRNKIYEAQGNWMMIDGENIEKVYDEWFDIMEIPKYGLIIKWNQSSCDLFLGVPINVLYYSFVCYVFAHYLGMKPLGIIGNLSNVHLYDNSFSTVEVLLSRDAKELEPVKIKTDFTKEWHNLDDYLRQIDYSNINLENYKHLGRLDVEMLPYSV